MRSGSVWVLALTMLRWCSDTTLVTSVSSRDRSMATTSMVATKTPDDRWSHSTSMRRSRDRLASDAALAQSARCTDTPRPRVTNPTISSPGTGVQHRDNRTIRSSRPST